MVTLSTLPLFTPFPGKFVKVISPDGSESYINLGFLRLTKDGKLVALNGCDLEKTIFFAAGVDLSKVVVESTGEFIDTKSNCKIGSLPVYSLGDGAFFLD